jgi:hypothetical protein
MGFINDLYDWLSQNKLTVYNFITEERWDVQPYSPDLVPTHYHLFAALKKTLCEVQTVVTQWLITQDAERHQQGIQSSSHDTINGSNVAGTTWKCNGTAVQLNLNCSY